MYKNQSNFCENLEQRKPLTEVYDRNEGVEMQILTRRVLLNLAKNVLRTEKKLGVNNVRAIGPQFTYSTESKKQKLLRFPAFPLNEMLDRLLVSSQPFLTKEELKQSQEAAENFLQWDGEKLQHLLEKQAECSENWLASRWLQAAYMQYRDPVTVHSSPGMAFPLQEFKSEKDYLDYCGKVIFCLLKYKQQIDAGEMPVVKMGKFELDNSQFHRVFGTIRIPIPHEDRMEYYPESRHIIVMYKNHFYKMDVYDDNCKPYHPDVYAKQLAEIMKAEECTGKGIDFGVLTTDKRDNWAAAYEVLMQDPNNRGPIQAIQQSLFTLSLDETVEVPDGKALNVQTDQLIHGGGTKLNSANRWMDKTIQVVVNRNGMSGFTYEHSPAEGQPIALMTDYIIKHLQNKDIFEKASRGDICAEKLIMYSSPCLEEHLATARNTVNRLANDLETHVMYYKNYGKEFLKKQKLSPDSFIQMAIQFAFYKLHKVPGAHYESAHLRIYDGGRTETIRSCSNESIAFAKAMLDTSVNDAKRIELLRTAVNGHRAYTTLALEGRGVDRHMLGLKLMAIENKLPIPEFYKDPCFVRSSHFRLSTSQVASVYEAFMGYGPITHDGYACCYNPRECDIILAMSAWRSNGETSVDQFAEAMSSALTEMWELLTRAGVKPVSKL